MPYLQYTNSQNVTKKWFERHYGDRKWNKIMGGLWGTPWDIDYAPDFAGEEPPIVPTPIPYKKP